MFSASLFWKVGSLLKIKAITVSDGMVGKKVNRTGKYPNVLPSLWIALPHKKSDLLLQITFLMVGMTDLRIRS